jgi:2-polyprenyl-3-methyl-5-hydroxy-6-metoxy-1,4-benzoquinol methylase
MSQKLTIIATEQNSLAPSPSSQRKQHRQEIQDKFEKLWQENPGQFDPERNVMQTERIERTLSLIHKYTTLEGKRVVDLGCGNGCLALKLANAGAQVDAVDISKHALMTISLHHHPRITLHQDLVPTTSLPDDTYDIVISTDLIGHLSREEHRLYMAELSRLVKPSGFVICSTAINIYTQDGVQAFGSLLETEFRPLGWVFSYHAYSIRLKYLLDMPQLFAQGFKDRSFRKEQLKKRSWIGKGWYYLNTLPIIGRFWTGFSYLTNPLKRLFMHNRFMLLNLERLCRTLSPESGISHVIFIGQRRPIEIPTQEELMAIVPKQKRLVWE